MLKGWGDLIDTLFTDVTNMPITSTTRIAQSLTIGAAICTTWRYVSSLTAIDSRSEIHF